MYKNRRVSFASKISLIPPRPENDSNFSKTILTDDEISSCVLLHNSQTNISTKHFWNQTQHFIAFLCSILQTRTRLYSTNRPRAAENVLKYCALYSSDSLLHGVLVIRVLFMLITEISSGIFPGVLYFFTNDSWKISRAALKEPVGPRRINFTARTNARQRF